MVVTERIKVKTKGNCDIINITDQVSRAISQSKLNNGTATVFNVGSTAGITTVEYYEHEQTWHDDNGHSHVRASLLGPSLAVPFIDGQPTLGTWQQIILVDFDTRARTRTVVCQIIGE